MKIVITVIALSTSLTAQMSSSAGAFERMGFGARGMSLGNAMTAVKCGELSGFYNPATIAFLKTRTASVSFGILSLDRNHNSLFFSTPIDTTAAISLGVLNSGVGNIDGRDYDGFHTETYSTSENMFSFSFGIKIRKIAVGVSTKLYYYSLFNDLSATGLGFDIGILYPLNSNFSIGAAIKDFNAKYKWNSSSLYEELGNTTIDRFPIRRSLGISYLSNDSCCLLTTEIEASNKSTTIIRFGAEYSLVKQLIIRAGFDAWDVKDSKQTHPSFGFTLHTDINGWQPALNYAYIIEPYGLSAIHVISISATL